MYLRAVRKLDIRGATPLLRDVQGFSHLLDLFPLANGIRSTHVTLSTTSRNTHEGDEPMTGTATLYVAVTVHARGDGDVWQAPIVNLRAFPSCNVVYDITLTRLAGLYISACPSDWPP